MPVADSLRKPDIAAANGKTAAGPNWFEAFLLFLPLIRLTIFLRGRTEFATVDSFALFDIAVMFLIGFYLLCVLNRIPWHKLFGSCMGWILAYYTFCIFSFLWRAPGTSAPYIIYRAVSMNVMILYAFYLMSRFQDQRVAFDGLLKYVFMIQLFGMIGAVKNGGFSFAMLHTNSYSFSAAVLAALALTAVKTQEKTLPQAAWYILAGVAGLVLGTSGGSNIAFAMALCFILCIARGRVNPLLVVLLPLLGMVAYELFLPEILELLFPGKTMEGIMSATGRTRVWGVYLDAWGKSPWLGYGFCVGEKVGNYFGYVYTLSAHNGLISVLINTGILGAFFFGMFLLSWVFGLLREVAKGSRNGVPIVAAFIVIMINNMSVPTIGSQFGALPTVVLLVGAYFALFCQTEPPRLPEQQGEVR